MGGARDRMTNVTEKGIWRTASENPMGSRREWGGWGLIQRGSAEKATKPVKDRNLQVEDIQAENIVRYGLSPSLHLAIF